MHSLAIISFILASTQVASSAPVIPQHFHSRRTGETPHLQTRSGHEPLDLWDINMERLSPSSSPPPPSPPPPPPPPPPSPSPPDLVKAKTAEAAGEKAKSRPKYKNRDKQRTRKPVNKAASSSVGSISGNLENLHLKRQFKGTAGRGIQQGVYERDITDENLNDAHTSTFAYKNTLRELFDRELTTTWIAGRNIDGLTTGETVAALD
ncbi:hypothetical protein K439DRAFT_1620348 [Ramaria rubella]|nr:hypothetical protein K439DRAFT_1620348 [Ramaria rubella]